MVIDQTITICLEETLYGGIQMRVKTGPDPIFDQEIVELDQEEVEEDEDVDGDDYEDYDFED